jgi:hypothetical protein
MPTDKYDLPTSWPARDVVQWLRATLDEPGTLSIELAKNGEGGITATVHSR